MFPVFSIEEYFSGREHAAKYLFSSSDAESWEIADLLELASPAQQAQWPKLRLNYTESRGSLILREKVAQHYPGLSPEDVLIVTGPEEGIFVSLYAHLKPEDHAIVITPCYQSLQSLAEGICEVTPIPLCFEDGWQLDLDSLQAAIRPNTKLLIMNFPHNPTGIVLERERWDTLIALCAKNGITILSDEVYRDLVLVEGTQLPSMATHVENSITLGGLSKAHGLPGLRVGWIICQDRSLLKRAEQVRHYLSICGSAPSEFLAEIALDHQDTLIARNVQLARHNLQHLTRFLNAHPDRFEWCSPQGGCICFPKWLETGRTPEHTIDQFAEQLMQGHRLMLLPGHVYQMKTPHFRLGFGRQNFTEALACFERALETRQSVLQ